MEHRFVIKLVQEDIYDDCDSDKSLSDNFQQQEDTRDNQTYIRQQALKKKMFLTTMICEDSDKHILKLKNEMSRKDPFDADTEFISEFESDINTLDGEDDQRYCKEDFMSTSEEDEDSSNNSVIGC